MTTVHASTLVGIDAIPVEVYASLVAGQPAFDLMGLPEAAVRETRIRVRAAVEASGLSWPRTRVTVAIEPMDLPKLGMGLDLAIAVAILAASGECSEARLDRWRLVGELGLRGQILGVRGALCHALSAKEAGARLLVSAEDAVQVAVLGVEARACFTLTKAVAFLGGRDDAAEDVSPLRNRQRTFGDEDDGFYRTAGFLAAVAYAPEAVRAMEIAAAGGHHVLLSGSRTISQGLAHWLPALLPPMDSEGALLASRVHSVAGTLKYSVGLLAHRPFRAPHSTVDAHGFEGRYFLGTGAIPGEAALAHEGVLYLDELPEFSAGALDALRLPLDEDSSVLVRLGFRARYPARFQLVGSLTPCPAGCPTADRCDCSKDRVERWQGRVPGWLREKVDLFVSTRLADDARRVDGGTVDPTQELASKVAEARRRMLERNGGTLNARLSVAAMRDVGRVTKGAAASLCEQGEGGMSASTARRVLRVARTIADLADAARVEEPHVAEAMIYRGQ